LTVTDHASRYLLTCEALSSTKEDYAFTIFERLFKERGLPTQIRSDNGVPFASVHALFNLSKLQSSLCRPSRRHQGSSRRYLARHFYGL
jgi:IS30 family transposase